MLLQLCFFESDTIKSGGAYWFVVCVGDAWDICQFWQNLHLRLQPALAIERLKLLGITWKNGFFSMGSIWMAQGCAYPRE
jgi:hypothetical protein